VSGGREKYTSLLSSAGPDVTDESSNTEILPSVEMPTRIRDYEIKGELGQGGMGVVYRAYDTKLAREVALKVLRMNRARSPKERARFELEARAAARLDHPGIVPVHDVGESAAGPYLVMDLVEGTTLQDVLDEKGCLEPRETAVLIEKLARALAHAHEQGVLHRDMKPANVIITRAGEPRIADFGLAKDLRETATLTETGSIVGTPGYMPPEQARGEATAFDPRFDVYSLGAILYECLTGEPPFVGASAVAILKRVASDEDPVPPSTKRKPLDKDLETICLHAIEKELDRRYPTAKDLADDLARYLAHEPILARPTRGIDRARKWLRRNKKLARALAVTIIIVGGAAAAETVALVHRLRDERDRAAERLALAEQASTSSSTR
jgi:serine/threonine protein kinase